MAHPYAGKASTGSKRAKEIAKGYNCGGMLKKADGGSVLKRATGGAVDTKVPGRKAGGRLDTFARGGRTKGKASHHTKININIAPKGPHPADGAASPAPLGPPPMGGGPPPPPMGPPGGGLPPGLGAGPPPGMKPPGMMARGGGIKMKGGAETGPGRLDKAKAYKARG